MTTINPALLLDSTMTTIVVGEERRKYNVHKELLRENLGYFKSAYNTSLAEAASDVFTIDDVPDLAFRSLITWLYPGKIYLDSGSGDALQQPDITSLHDERRDDGSFTWAWHKGLRGYEEWEEEKKDDDNSDDEEDSNSEEENDDDDGDDEDNSDNEIEYEFDSNSDADAFHVSEPLGPLSSDEASQKELEQAVVHLTFPQYTPMELDAYQLDVLVRIHSATRAPYADSKFVSSWKKVLKQMKQDQGGVNNDQHQPDPYDWLVDLYILADRFDNLQLRVTVIAHLEGHRAAQADLLHGQALPTFQTVAKAFQFLPDRSNLRKWLLYVFAFFWRPSGDGVEQKAARELLPRDFLLELAVTYCEHNYYATGEDDSQAWKWFWLSNPLHESGDRT